MEGPDSDDAIRAEFEAMVLGWHDELLDQPSEPSRGLTREAGGVWIDGESGRALPPERSAEVERLWRQWAPKLPDEVRQLVERGDNGGDEAGDREPLSPAPAPPSLSQEFDS